MKVILTEDVKSLGKKGEIVNVSDGYARNFILKKNKGVEANGKNLNDLKLKKANDDKIAQQQYEDAQELGKKIEAGKIEVAIKMGEGGKAFGSVSSKEIAEEVKKQMDLTIDKKKVQLKEAIRTLGTHNVPDAASKGNSRAESCCKRRSIGGIQAWKKHSSNESCHTASKQNSLWSAPCLSIKMPSPLQEKSSVVMIFIRRHTE